MDFEGQRVFFELFGVSWTLPLIGTAIGGTIGAIGTLYKVGERWSTRKARRLALLNDFLSREEKDITALRRPVLAGIQFAQRSYLDGKNLDVGSELDDALKLLDSGRTERAEARLRELLKKIQGNSGILKRRIEDLTKHERSINVFLAALADQMGQTDVGLGYIRDALVTDTKDLDALKYKGLLQLKKDQLDEAERSFEKLKLHNEGEANRADAHLGLASVLEKRGVSSFDEAARAAALAITNLDKVPPLEQDVATKVRAHQLLGRLYSDLNWAKSDVAIASANYKKALALLNSVPKNNRTVSDWTREISSALWSAENDGLKGQNEGPAIPRH
jgi:hypothetical protein